MAGQSRIDPRFVAERLNLTPSEGQVAALLADGLSVKEIAAATGRQPTTVRWFLKTISRKLDTHSQSQLVRAVLLLLVPDEEGGGHAAKKTPPAVRRAPRPG